MITLTGTRFGTIEFDSAATLLLENGLIGLPDLREFVLVETKPGSAFSWLQSLDEPALAFLVADPDRYAPGYGDSVVARANDIPDAVVLTTASVPPGKPQETTLNLAGPIVLNANTRRGRQMVLDDSTYTTPYRVFPQKDSEYVRAA